MPVCVPKQLLGIGLTMHWSDSPCSSDETDITSKIDAATQNTLRQFRLPAPVPDAILQTLKPQQQTEPGFVQAARDPVGTLTNALGLNLDSLKALGLIGLAVLVGLVGVMFIIAGGGKQTIVMEAKKQ